MPSDPAAASTVPQSFLSWNNGPLFNMISTSRLDQLFNSAYQPVASSPPKNDVEKQLEQLQAEKGIQPEPITEEEAEALREYLQDPSAQSSASSTPGNAADWEYPDPTLADMRKVLGNPNSDVGVAEGGYYFVSGMRFLFEDVATLLDPESTPDEIAMASLFTLFKPMKAADKGLDLAGAGKKVEEVGGGARGNIGWSMSDGGGVINGRNYSQHALERMAPNNPEVKAILTTRAIKKAEDIGYKPQTKEFSDFIKKYVDPRDIPPSVIEDAILNAKKIPGNRIGTFIHETQDIKVIVNEAGNVITVIPK
ncbi:hypothetical protein P6709_06735 [Jeotgalibacillus sp. ET6]|uniref:hypothetical protein n=1 Tax=Jeotgalibacillus sp. ET6 TaxID=3037260 RepID=UPI0024181D82|nr:hypothetical protein [Jeotgalibacillus sp. ET6]MDG5471437.1 hypothetical protein [Jeotgalibacillus sp. ET6]